MTDSNADDHTQQQLVPSTGRSLDDIFPEMVQQAQLAFAGLFTQNAANAQAATLRAQALYEEARKYKADSDADLQILNVIKHFIRLIFPLVQSNTFLAEGDFGGAQTSIAAGVKVVNDAIDAMDLYARNPDADQQFIEEWRPVLPLYLVMFNGIDRVIEADIVGYQGNVPEYIERLEKAANEYQTVLGLPPSRSETFIALYTLCSGNADRIQRRIRNFKARPPQIYSRPTGNKIFIIHGHDEAKWRDLRDLLQQQFKLETVVLKDEAEGGRTLIQKFEEIANDCCYAFALLTPDDVIDKDGKKYLQSRPNVIFELGWFYGRFGRERVCLVKKSSTETPSDLGGILTVDFNTDVSEGFVKIQKELRKVGVIA